MDEEWYRRRSYAHFDSPLPRAVAIALATDPGQVARHAFWPLIINPRRSISRKLDATGVRRVVKEKRRPIGYCAHSDAYIYSYYAALLHERLEQIYAEWETQHVLAYRCFDPAQCNIHFAVAAFREAEARAPCDVVALDVEGFFDSLRHDHLKQAWQSLLGLERLPADHHAVFRACTADTAILLPDLRDALGGEIRRRAGRDGSAICKPSVFREHVVPLLRRRHAVAAAVKQEPGCEEVVRAMGIPQGLPISAVLANVYMLDADLAIATAVHELGGSYRRYSDDILVILPAGTAGRAEQLIEAELHRIGLNVKRSKTERCRVRTTDGRLSTVALSEDGTEGKPRKASYLGLTFDGERIALRQATIARFQEKARRAITRAKLAARRNGEVRLRRRQLYAKLTSLGYGRAYGKLQGSRLRSGVPRLGFHRYLRLAADVTSSLAIIKLQRQLDQQVMRWLREADQELAQPRV